MDKDTVPRNNIDTTYRKDYTSYLFKVSRCVGIGYNFVRCAKKLVILIAVLSEGPSIV